MPQNTFRWTKPERQTTRSKVMFTGDFKAELKKNIEELEEIVEREVSQLFTIDSVITGNSDLKIRINDEEKGIRKIITCIFWYHHDEEKFGNIHVEIVSSELSKKTRTHVVGTFRITDRKKIQEAVLQDLIFCIKEIH